MASRIFLYVNSNKQIRVQHIHDVTENDTYFQGISLLDSEHGKLKTFRKDRVIQDLDSLPEDEEIYIFITAFGSAFFSEGKLKNDTFARKTQTKNYGYDQEKR